MIKAVVFDLDHTLFDRHATLRKIAKYFRKEFDINENISDEYIAEKWIYADDHFIYDGWQYIFAYLKESNIFRTAPEYAEYRSFVYKYFARTAVKFEETLPMLTKLKNDGYKVGLITNGQHSLQYSKLKLLGLTDIFDEIIVSGDTSVEKPDKEIFLLMCEKLVISPSEMIYVGDNPINDINGARNAGCSTVWIKSTGSWIYKYPPADISVDLVQEIPDAVEKISKNMS